MYLYLTRQMLNLCYLYYLSKLTEFADTMFFVLRKKSSQITWLHVYHHSVTPLETWVLVKFLAGELSRPAIINKLSPLKSGLKFMTCHTKLALNGCTFYKMTFN